MPDPLPRGRLVGINHVALEVGDISQALGFYGSFLDYELRSPPSDRMAFIDAGDQFLALRAPRTQPADDGRHFGLVVDDRDAVRAALRRAGIRAEPGRGLRVRDPWGNLVELVQYDEIQYTKSSEVLDAMRLGHLTKTDAARRELEQKLGRG